MKTGGCQCGAIRFEVTGAAQSVYACHCSECRKQSASAFGISAIHAPEDLRVITGRPKRWSRPTDSGGSMDCFFCENCGSRLWHAGDGVISVKGGALDETPQVSRHIWTARKLSWVVIPEGAQQWAEEPDC